MGSFPRQSRTSPAGFTIVEVMMASVILVVGFMGMIQAVTIGSEMLATARRQTIASQILNHELERLRLQDWATIQSLSTTTTWNSGTSYPVNTTVQYQGGWFVSLIDHSNHAPPESPYWAPATSIWSITSTYSIGDVAYYSVDGNWYRYSNSSPAAGNLPTSATYWEAYSGPLTSSTVAGGLSFSISRIVTDITTDLREVTYVVSWTKSGTTTAAATPTGTWLERISFSRASPIARTYTRQSTSWFTKYGLNYAAQRS